MPLDLVATLSELVSIPSVNPMGREVAGDQYYEHHVTAYLEQLFQRLGVTYERQFVHPKRENILARLDGSTPPEDGGPLLLFEAHQDTVPVEGMTIEPWAPTVRDGRLYGRGSCDIKGGLTAMLGAFARLAADRPSRMPTLVLACTVNEEHGYTGATALTKLWNAPSSSKLLSRRPDAAVIAEPTSLNVVVAHKGTVRWRAHTHGRAAHSSQPHLGDNAIYKMGRVLAACQRYAEEFAPALPRHPLCGGVTLSVGTIHGGLSVNTVPDRATIEIDRRLLPGEDPAQALRQVIDYIAGQPGIDFAIDHEPPFLQGPALADVGNDVVADLLVEAARRTIGRGEKVGVPYGTDAATLAGIGGVPSIVFGPGSIDQAHTADEWLPLAELTQASDVLFEFVRGYCR